MGELEGELAGLGLFDGVSGELRDVGFELFLFGSAEGEVFKGRGEKRFDFGHEGS